MASLVEDKANAQWIWYINTYTDYYAFAFILFNLSRFPDLSARAWNAIDRLTPSSNGAWYPFRRLLELAWTREKDGAGSTKGPTPDLYFAYPHYVNNGFETDGWDGFTNSYLTTAESILLDQMAGDTIGSPSFWQEQTPLG